MLAAIALALAVAGSGIAPPAPLAIGSVPDESGAFMLPEAPTYQAVAADVDGDGTREVVRLAGSGRDAIDVEAWSFADGGWERVGTPVNVVPERPTASQGSIVYTGSPVRLLVRHVDGHDRITLVRQPRFDEPALHVECCLLLDDVVIADGSLRLANVSERLGSADAILAIDLDGDETDELLVTRGRPPLGDTTFPTDAWVLRWSGTSFAAPVLTELGVGSGHSPFILGDSDGVPGDEAAFIAAQGRLHRISWRPGDVLGVESGEAGLHDALAVPFGEGRGIALVDRFGGLSVHVWPRDAPFAASVRSPLTDHGDLLGVVTIPGREPELFVRGASADSLMRFSTAGLNVSAGSVTRSPSAGTLAAGPVPGYVGPLFGGGLDGGPAIIYAGRLLPSDDLPRAGFATAGAALSANLAGIVPLGLVGPQREWVALWHRAAPTPTPDPTGGRLDAPVAHAGSGVSLVPLALVRQPELDDGILEPPIDGALKTGPEIIVGAAGFTATITAPPGSRAYLAAWTDMPPAASVVPPSGVLEVSIDPETDEDRYHAQLVVVTPGGHGYLAAWNVRVLDRPPEVTATTTTAIGQANVRISGRTAADAAVTVGGHAVAVTDDGSFEADIGLPPWPTSVEIVATDALGNESRVAVTGVGWFDYRTLPWATIVLVALAAAGVAVAVRVPRARLQPVPADEGDAVLEDLEPEA